MPALALLLAASAFAADSATFILGRALSAGLGRPVTAPLTFNRDKAAKGGFIYAAARLGAADAKAVRLSEAVLTSANGPEAALARKHKVPALAVTGGWEGGGLTVTVPVLSAPATVKGSVVRTVERYESRRLREGELLTVDAENGLVTLVPAAEQPFELELAQALRAFDGLRDLQALMQWYDSRAEKGSPALAARLVSEMTARLAAGSASQKDFERVRRALEASLDAAGRHAVAEAAASAARRHLRGLAVRLEEMADEARFADTRAAVDSLSAAARRAAAAGKALASGVGRPDLAKRVEESAAALAQAARARAAALPEAASGERQALAAAGAAELPSASLPASLYTRFIEQSGIGERLERLADDASLGLRRKDERLEALFEQAALTPASDAGRAILAAAPPGELVTACGPDGCSERAPRARLLDAVKEAWSLSWSAGPLGRRKRAGKPFSPPAVRLESFLPAESSGVAYSRDPVTGSFKTAVVQCAFGEFDALIGGDEYVLDRRALTETAKTTADKRLRLDADRETGDFTRSVVPPGLSLSRCLTPAQAAQAAKAARALDQVLGRPVELSFAYAGGKLYARSWR